jgi:hypothetical protein
MKCCASTGRSKKAGYQGDWSTEEKREHHPDQRMEADHEEVKSIVAYPSPTLRDTVKTISL